MDVLNLRWKDPLVFAIEPPTSRLSRQMNRSPGSVEKLWARALGRLRIELEGSV